MKLESYTPQVSGNVIHGNISSPNLPAAFGADTSGMNALAGALGKAAETLQAQWIKGQNDNVIDANNEYQRRINDLLYNEQTGLTYTMQGKNAENLQAAYMEAEKKIRAEVADKYKINNKYAVSAFEKQIDSSVTSSLATIDRFQRKGLEDYSTAQKSEILTNAQNQLIRDPNSFTTLWANTEQGLRAIDTKLGIDEETQNVSIKKSLNTLATNTLQYMYETDDYKNGLNFVSILRANGADETIIKKYENQFQKKEISTTSKNDFEKFVKDNNINLTKMSVEDAIKLYDEKHPFTMPTIAGVQPRNPKILPYMNDFLALQKKYGWSDEVLRRFIAMGDHENAGTWDPKIEAGNGDGGLGLYQFMPETAAQYGLTDRTDPHANIAAAGEMFNESLKLAKGDLDKATLMHNGGQSGEGVRNAAAAGYLEKVKDDEAGLFGGGVSEEQMAYYKEARDNAIKSQFAEIRQAQQQEISNALTQINAQLLEMDKAGNNVFQQYGYVESALENNPLLKDSAQGIALMQGMLNKKQAFENAQKQAEFSAKGFNPDGTVKKEGLEYLINQFGVTIKTEADLKKKLKWITDQGGGLSPQQLDLVYKNWADYASGRGPHAVDIGDSKETIAALAGVTESQVDSEALAMIKQEIFNYIQKNGGSPNQSVRRDIYQKVLAEHQIGGTMKYGGFLGFNQKEASLSLSELQERELKISDISQAIDARKNPTGFYVQSAEDGRTRYVTFDEMEKIKNHEMVLTDIPVER